jgi:hypothetical protein
MTNRARSSRRVLLTGAGLLVVGFAALGAGCAGSDSNDGYTPKDRATQFAQRLHDQDGDPAETVTCKFESVDGGGAEWYSCTGRIWIACQPHTTAEPLSDGWNRPNLVWGDCVAD